MMSERLDLRGVKCPLNWAKAKVRLEVLPPGSEVELIVDDPKGARDIPRAAEAEGYAVANVERRQADWRIVIHT
jgi:tRNA 2-thiouridine synthesizing protein A